MAGQSQGTVPGNLIDTSTALQDLKSIVASGQNIGPDPGAGLTVPKVSAAPGATEPYGVTAVPNIRMPMQPPPFQMSPTRVNPISTSLHDQRIANAQTWGNLLGNAVGGLATIEMQKNYNDKVTVIKDFLRAKVENDKANAALKINPNDPIALKQQRESGELMDKIQRDKKQWRTIQDAIPNYINPSENDPTDTAAHNQAVKEEQYAEISGTNNDSLEKKHVSDLALAAQRQQQTVPGGQAGAPSLGYGTGQQPATLEQQDLGRRQLTAPGVSGPVSTPAAKKEAMGPSVGGQSRVTLPYEMGMNPAYEAQVAAENKRDELMLTHVVPALINQNAANLRAAAQRQTELTKSYFDMLGKLDVEDSRVRSEYNKVAATNAKDIIVAQIHADGLGLAAGDPRLAGGVPGAAGKMITNLNTAINGRTQDISRDMDTITNADAALTKLRSVRASKQDVGQIQFYEDQKAAAQARIKTNGDAINKFNDTITNLQKLGGAGQGAAGAGMAGGISIPGVTTNIGGGIQPGAGAAAPVANTPPEQRTIPPIKPSDPRAIGAQGLAAAGTNAASADKAAQNLTKTFEGPQQSTKGGIAGEPLVGYGHLIRKGEPYTPGQVISDQVREKLFQQDWADAKNKLNAVTGGQRIPPPIAGVLTDFIYQRGRLDPPVLAAVKSGDWMAVAKSIMPYDYYTAKSGQEVHNDNLAQRRYIGAAIIASVAQTIPGKPSAAKPAPSTGDDSVFSEDRKKQRELLEGTGDLNLTDEQKQKDWSWIYGAPAQ